VRDVLGDLGGGEVVGVQAEADLLRVAHDRAGQAVAQVVRGLGLAATERAVDPHEHTVHGIHSGMADKGAEVTELDLRDDRVAARVHAVGLRAYRVEADLIGFDGIPALGESVARMRALPLRWLGVAAPDPVAFLAYTDDDVVDVDRLCVDPDWFRRGLARALLTALLERTTGDVVVSTGAANTPAITLYERAGFTRTGTVSPVAGLTIATFRLQRG